MLTEVLNVLTITVHVASYLYMYVHQFELILILNNTELNFTVKLNNKLLESKSSMHVEDETPAGNAETVLMQVSQDLSPYSVNMRVRFHTYMPLLCALLNNVYTLYLVRTS